jgi:hypothetical protein
MKSKVHAGAKSQFGGVKDGLFISLYHVLTEVDVKILPTKPTINGIARDTINFKTFDISPPLNFEKFYNHENEKAKYQPLKIKPNCMILYFSSDSPLRLFFLL